MAVQDKVVSLFSGAGGLSLGFCQAGLKPVVGADIDADACRTYRENLGIDVLNLDLSKEHAEFTRLVAEVREPFAIIGGPPCQGFSSAGAKNGSDKRNDLIFQYLSLVERIRPRWFIFENVEGLLTANGGKSVANLARALIKTGYTFRLEKVNLAAYGLPQSRKRVILIGNRIGLGFSLPPQTYTFNAGKHKSHRDLPASPTLDEALTGIGTLTSERKEISPYISDIPLNAYDALMRIDNNYGGVYLHFSICTKEMTDMFSNLRPGQTMRDLPAKYWHSSFERRAFRRVMDGTPTDRRGGAPSGVKRLYGNLNALTITSAATREFVHPYEDRPLTLREAARLQSFPDRYHFSGSNISIARQIGNAFPPLAAKVFAEHLINLEGSFGADRRSIPDHPEGAFIGYHLTDSTGMSPALVRTDALLAEIVEEFRQKSC